MEKEFLMCVNGKATFFTLLLSVIFCFGVVNTATADVISAVVNPELKEPANTYNQGLLNIVDMNVVTVIGTGPCITGNYVGCTFNDVLNDVVATDNFKPEIQVHMTASDFPDDGLVTNAAMRQRGATSRSAAQKSFRIKLKSKKKLWRKERRIQLVKSAFDYTRIRNKLSYDLMSEIPHLPSMRTQFIHLTVTDQGIDIDSGLYTHVEHFGKEYLVRRGWDKDSRVYKAENMNFYNNSAFALDATGAPVDLVAFEKLLEIKRGTKHTALANMLRDLNNPNIDFNTQIMGKYFNRDNYLTWFAVNILLGNADTNYHNFYLYNPKGTEHFYMIPWDYDLSLEQPWSDPNDKIEYLPRWWFSQANWWDILLHRRFLSEPGNLALLKQAVLEVKTKYLTPAKIQAKADAFKNLTFPIIRQQPDWNYLYVSGNTDAQREASYNQSINKLKNAVNASYNRFMQHVNDPMPFYMDAPVFLANHDIIFEWTEAVSLTNQSIYYDLEVATDKTFKAGSIVRRVTGITNTVQLLHWRHPKGTYYFRVIARDAANPQGHWQEAVNDSDLTYANNNPVYGILKMYVAVDGDTTPPPVSTVSNPVSSISVDGNSSDWSGLKFYTTDPNDVVNNANNVVNWRKVGLADNTQNLYFMYDNYVPIDPLNASGSNISWGYQAMIDTDKNPSTGFRFSDVLGADYLLAGGNLFQYKGTGSDWNWVAISGVNSRFSGHIFEAAIPRGVLGNPASIRVIFYGLNEAFGGTTTDIYPDDAYNISAAVRYFEYSFGTVMPPANHAPVTKNQSVTVVENSKLTINLDATDADNDALKLSIITQPRHGTLVFSQNSLVVEYQPSQNYTGSDSFRFRVNDGKANSNTSKVNVTVNATPVPSVISNHVVSGAITVNGISSDWNGLKLFANDPDDVPAGASNVIDWRNVGLAHSNNMVYLLFNNRGNMDSASSTGSTLKWGYQTFIDTDSNATTGFKFSSKLGMDYLLEGRHLYKYTGDGNSWGWVEVGVAVVKFKNSIAEISFPRSLLGNVSGTIKIVFYGNNAAFGGSTSDLYPNSGSFKYSFGSGMSGRPAPVVSAQKGVRTSSISHKIKVNVTNTPKVTVKKTKSNKAGGSFSWVLIFLSMLFVRRHFS